MSWQGLLENGIGGGVDFPGGQDFYVEACDALTIIARVNGRRYEDGDDGCLWALCRVNTGVRRYRAQAWAKERVFEACSAGNRQP